MSRFEEQLRTIINQSSLENASNTPDHILAHYLDGCLANFTTAVKHREAWYGRYHGPTGPHPGLEPVPAPEPDSLEKIKADFPWLYGARPKATPPPQHPCGPPTMENCGCAVTPTPEPPTPSMTTEQYSHTVRTLSSLSPVDVHERQRAISAILHHEQRLLSDMDVLKRQVARQEREITAFRRALTGLDGAPGKQDEILLVGRGWNYRAKMQSLQVVPMMGVLVVHVDEPSPRETLEQQLAAQEVQITYLQEVGTRHVQELRDLQQELTEIKEWRDTIVPIFVALQKAKNPNIRDSGNIPAIDPLVARIYSCNAQDADRFRWLCEDHSDGPLRARRNSLLYRMQGMSYVTACQEIDAAMIKEEPA